MNSNLPKEFFRKPIVAVTGAVILLSVFVRFIFGFTGLFRIPNLFYDEAAPNSLISELPKYNINVFALFLALVFLLLFVKSRSAAGSLGGVCKFFKAGSITGLVLLVILAVLLLTFAAFIAIAAILGVSFLAIRFLPVALFSYPVIGVGFFAALVASVVMVLLAISQLLFAGSVNKAVKGEKSGRGTAVFFAVVSFTAAALLFMACSVIALIDFKGTSTAVTVNLLVSIPPYFFTGITAASYSGYIKRNKPDVSV